MWRRKLALEETVVARSGTLHFDPGWPGGTPIVQKRIPCPLGTHPDSHYPERILAACRGLEGVANRDCTEFPVEVPALASALHFAGWSKNYKLPIFL